MALLYFSLGVAAAVSALWRVPSLATAVFGPDFSRIAAGAALPTDTRIEALKALAQASVAAAMRDPAAAQFSDIKVVDGREGKNVCGYVNGKNAFGAYVGATAFAYDRGADRVLFWVNGGGEEETLQRVVVTRMCSDGGKATEDYVLDLFAKRKN
ncbi:hypothetical protein CH341_17565 [Rhodoplanes roseus]|uniref:Uncharacterized protein n=2 Tax=Rhodoplanes roseus TaxID=29409 RepID=A0A327KZY6_9BRAD|nr:hypothetical protein CH341_17565 [Rhodoplanes roseus]